MNGVPRVKADQPITLNDVTTTAEELMTLRSVVEGIPKEETLFSPDDALVLEHAANLLIRFAGLALYLGLLGES